VRGRLAITTGTAGRPERSSSSGPAEGELLARLQAGDEEAFACLVDRHHAAMVRIARGYVRSQAVAEEVAQEAWLGLLRGLDRQREGKQAKYSAREQSSSLSDREVCGSGCRQASAP